ncbi:two-component sensor histidine kinase [Kushneria pakistanensis]|uniref:histidine kinase n=1 Tax=Kushneria pakistanensis TaxID=1508770 RepID=A0ABQ3F9Z6_9GAMM|nr:ATP-binding protein [Kushneria pakistanensis]GHC15122.1 two-component sensor histidine kinase [Kushneria pakistanensis]
MFSRLGLKLLGAIVLVNVVLGALIFFVAARGIDDDFLGYLRRTQEARIDTLSETLIEGYARHGSWNWLAEDRTAWRDVLRLTLMPRLQDPSSARAAPGGLPPPMIDPRQFVLRDTRGQTVIGGFHAARNDMRYRELKLDGEPIGQLGYRAPDGIITSIDKIFLHRQLRNLGIITGAMLLTSLLLASGLAWWLGRRIRDMAQATQAIAHGDYTLRLRARGKDELSRLSSDINALARGLEHNRQSRQQWVADIAHELRTPLAILRGEIEAMQDGVRALDQRSLQSLAQEVSHLNRLIEDLRLLAQSDAHTLEAPLEHIDLSAQLHQQLEESREWLAERGIILTLDITPHLFIQGAPHRLRQLWHNLLSNTQAYTNAPGLLHVTLKRQGHKAVVIWEDSAPGVAPAQQHRLTERLFRVDDSRSRRHGGSGLGLAIASALVRLHGAQMTPAPSPLGGLRWHMSFALDEGT